jgi:hypothetical protein
MKEVELHERWSQTHVVDGNGARQLLAWPARPRLEQADDWSAAVAKAFKRLVALPA